MIAKRIMAPQGGAGYQRLAGLRAERRSGEHQRGHDPASWTRLNAYILDTDHARARKSHGRERPTARRTIRDGR